MKKLLPIVLMVLFVGGLTAPVIAATADVVVAIELSEDDPKKKADKSDDKNAKAKSKSSKKHTAGGDADCSKKCEGEKKSDCSKSSKGEA